MKKKVKMNSGCKCCDRQDRMADAIATYITATIPKDEIRKRLQKVWAQESESLDRILRELHSPKKKR